MQTLGRLIRAMVLGSVVHSVILGTTGIVLGAESTKGENPNQNEVVLPPVLRIPFEEMDLTAYRALVVLYSATLEEVLKKHYESNTRLSPFELRRQGNDISREVGSRIAELRRYDRIDSSLPVIWPVKPVYDFENMIMTINVPTLMHAEFPFELRIEPYRLEYIYPWPYVASAYGCNVTIPTFGQFEIFKVHWCTSISFLVEDETIAEQLYDSLSAGTAKLLANCGLERMVRKDPKWDPYGLACRIGSGMSLIDEANRIQVILRHSGSAVLTATISRY